MDEPSAETCLSVLKLNKEVDENLNDLENIYIENENKENNYIYIFYSLFFLIALKIFNLFESFFIGKFNTPSDLFCKLCDTLTYILFIFSLYFFFIFIFKAFLLFFKKTKKNSIKVRMLVLFVNKNIFYLVLSVSIFFLNNFVNNKVSGIENYFFYKKKDSDKNVMLGPDFLFPAFESLSYILFFYILKNFLIYSLNYITKLNNYYKKIKVNNEKLKLLNELNSLAEAKPDETTTEVCQRLFEKLVRKTDNKIHFTDLSHHLGEINAKSLISFADPTGDFLIEKEELLGFFKKTIAERKWLFNSIESTNNSISTIDNFFIGILGVISLLIFLINFNFMNFFMTYLTLISSSLISGSFCFSDTVKKFVSSALFVFFIRPYDLDDEIIIEDKHYKVKEINLLSSVFLLDNLVVFMSNDNLYSKSIINVTLSKSKEENFVFILDAQVFLKQSSTLRKALHSFSKRHANMFSVLPYFSKIEIHDSKKIKLTIQAAFNLQYQDTDVIQQRKNTFTLTLHEIFNELELKIE